MAINTGAITSALAVARLKSVTKLDQYHPYSWQAEFHEAGVNFPERMLMAANRVGKCISKSSYVDTPSGPTQIGQLQRGALVWAFDQLAESCTQAHISEIITKPPEPLFRILLSSGTWLETALNHRVLCLDGLWRNVGDLLPYAPNLSVTNLDVCRLILLADVLRLMSTGGGFQFCYQVYLDLSDEQLLLFSNTDLVDLPLQVGVLQHTAVSFDGGGQGSRSSGNPSTISHHLTSSDVLTPYGVQKALYEAQIPGNGDPQNPYYNQEVRQLFSEIASSLLSNHEGSLDQCPVSALLQSPNNGANRIVCYQELPPQVIYDMTVPLFHNYCAAGLINHNTHSAGAEVSMHATGKYPPWWQGKRFAKPCLVWCGSVTNEASRDIVQKELLGGTGEALGTGYIPKANVVGKPQMRQAGVSDVVDKLKVRHVSGGVSEIVFKTYDQGWRKWQGTAPHVVWLDEEPDGSTSNEKRIYSESQTRVMTSHGIIMVTFTPLLGETDLVRHFASGNPGTYLRTATWDDAPHLNDEDKTRLAAAYPDHEREARTKGVPMMGEGRIFSVDEADIKCEPFEIPRYFHRICGIDFGIDHPAAAAWMAFDRDRDIWYVYDCYRKRGETAMVHAAIIQQRPDGDIIPVAWPHDGMNREKSGGERLIDGYKGINKLAMSARYEAKKGGGQPQEPIIYDILERMRTGRFKVFSPLGDFFEEFRSYHRKDGIIQSNRDDILKSVFYGCMMQRYALPSRPSRLRQAPSQPIMSMP